MSTTRSTTSKKRPGILVRFDDDVDKTLRHYEAKGLNMSELIRKCVKKSLTDVVAELGRELSLAESASGIERDQADEVAGERTRTAAPPAAPKRKRQP